MSKPYLIAANEVEEETIVSRSRFICFLAPCSSVNDAKQMLKKLQLLHPQASHHCSAFLSGRPEDSQGYGFSDDGEPSGTAGKPMLSMLQGSGVGEICAIVVRYFGGTKLGTGGLQRAYGASVRQALTLLKTENKVPMVQRSLVCDYQQINTIHYLLEQVNGKIITQDYAGNINLVISLPEEHIVQIQEQLKTLTAGLLTLNTIEP
jgi:uncharacterized YigZ family protein